MDTAVKLQPLRLRILDTIADDDHSRGQDLEVVFVASRCRYTVFDIGVKVFGGVEVARGAEDGFGGLGGELAAGFALACLNYYWPALDL